jgi:hypothetical protein
VPLPLRAPMEAEKVAPSVSIDFAMIVPSLLAIQKIKLAVKVRKNGQGVRPYVHTVVAVTA